MSSLSPRLINEGERRAEVAHLLAIGILRHKISLRRDKKEQHPSHSFDLRVFPSIHGEHETHKNHGETDG